MNVIQQGWAFLTASAHWHGSDGIPTRFAEHLQYTALALFIAAAVALPLGLLAGHTRRGGFAVTTLANVARALPTLGVLVLLIFFWLGVELRALVISLVALGIPPILLNTYEGIRSVDPQLTDAARGMGLKPAQVLFRAEFPAALPLILTGLRGGAVQILATATIAAYGPFGGFGRYIIDGYALQDYEQVIGGAFLVAATSILLLAFFGLLRRLLVSPGIRKQG